MSRSTVPQNNLIGGVPSPFLETNTLTGWASQDIGAGGSCVVVEGAGPNEEDIFQFEINGASAQHRRTKTISAQVNEGGVGIWIKLLNPTEITGMTIFLSPDNFTNYFAHTLAPNDLMKSGWFFHVIDRSNWANQGLGNTSWDDIMTQFRLIAVGQAGAVGGEQVQVGPIYINLNTKPKVIISFDDANDTDITVGKAKLDEYGYKGVSYVIQSKIGTTNFLTEANLATMDAAGWDILGHHTTELDTLNLAEQITLLTGVRAWLNSLGYKDKHFSFPGGKYTTDTPTAMIAAEMISGRTTDKRPINPAISGHSPYNLTAYATAQLTTAQMLADVDQSILEHASCIFFSHGLFVGATGIHTEKSNWEAFIDGLYKRENQGLCEVVSLTEYLNGLQGVRQAAISRATITNRAVIASRVAA